MENINTAPVLRERFDDVEIARLNRPDKRDALDLAALELLVATLEELATDAQLRVQVLSTTNVRASWAGARLGVPVGPARLGPLIGLARAALTPGARTQPRRS